MPVKIRKLRADLSKAGFLYRPGKGSHGHWYYHRDKSIKVSLAGKDGDDAKKYQLDDVYKAIKHAKELG